MGHTVLWLDFSDTLLVIPHQAGFSVEHAQFPSLVINFPLAGQEPISSLLTFM